MKFDCFDGSDEESCSDYDGDLTNDGAFRFDEEDMNAFPRVFSYASILSPNQTNSSLYTYITAASDDQSAATVIAASRSGGVSKEEVTNSVPTDGPKGFGMHEYMLHIRTLFNLLQLIFSKLSRQQGNHAD